MKINSIQYRSLFPLDFIIFTIRLGIEAMMSSISFTGADSIEANDKLVKASLFLVMFFSMASLQSALNECKEVLYGIAIGALGRYAELCCANVR